MSDTQIQLGSDRVLTLWGTNLAIVYGMGLILAAIILALVYMRATRQRNG